MKKIYLILSVILFCANCFSQSRYIPDTTKKIVYTRDAGSCKCCGSSENLEYDHIIPHSCGGNSEVSNIQLLCKKCNRSKSNSCICKVHNNKVGNNCCEGQTTNISSESRTKQSSSTTIQCSGTTKKGARCKNMTTNSNGRCYLH